MKIRNGFVSNSSSSSFIIGIVNTGVNGEGEVFDPVKSLKRGFKFQQINENEYKLSIGSFMYDTVSCIIKPGEHFLYLKGTGPDGDHFFSVYDSNGNFCDIDYDKIDLSDFDNDDISLYEKIQSLGGQVSFGAGRDG